MTVQRITNLGAVGRSEYWKPEIPGDAIAGRVEGLEERPSRMSDRGRQRVLVLTERTGARRVVNMNERLGLALRDANGVSGNVVVLTYKGRRGMGPMAQRDFAGVAFDRVNANHNAIADGQPDPALPDDVRKSLAAFYDPNAAGAAGDFAPTPADADEEIPF